MKFSALCFAVTFLLAGVSSFAQYEDLVTPPDAPTRIAERESVVCTLEGVQIIKKDAGGGSKDVNVVFLLTEKPSSYFNYYDPQKKAVVFDFYDTRIGESIIDSVRESPISNSKVESFKIDLNKEVEGLKPDIRDVVRVSLFTSFDFPYDVQEDEGVITMNFKWSGRTETQMKRAKSAFYWEFPLGLAVAGGLGFGAYEIWLKKKPATPDPLPCCPDHPIAP